MHLVVLILCFTKTCTLLVNKLLKGLVGVRPLADKVIGEHLHSNMSYICALEENFAARL